MCTIPLNKVVHVEFHLGTSPKTVTPKRTPSLPITLVWKEEMMVEMKSLTLVKLVSPTLHDSSTRNTMSACPTVLHAEGRRMRESVGARMLKSKAQEGACLQNPDSCMLSP